MKIFFDTEFIEDGTTIDLLSIGMVAEDGRVLYTENREADMSKASDWVKENVLPHLKNCGITKAEIAERVLAFVGKDKPEFWAYYCSYDWVVFCQLFGSMMNLPTGYPMYCNDIKQLCNSLGNPKLPLQTSNKHDALQDAIWTKEAYEFLRCHNVMSSL
jgi:hypothetical protein